MRVYEKWTNFISDSSLSKKYNIEFRALKDGECRYFAGYASPIIVNGTIDHYVRFTIELTVEKNLQQQLRDSNHSLLKYRLLVESLRQGNWVSLVELSAAGALIKVDENLPGIVGHPADEVRGDGWVKTIYPDDRGEFIAKFAQYIQNKTQDMLTLSCRVIAADSSMRYVKSVIVPLLEGGEISGYISVLFSMTDQVLLAEKNSLYKRILDDIKVPISIADARSLDVFYVNAYAKKLFEINDTQDDRINVGQLDSVEGLSVIKSKAIPALQSSGRWQGETGVLTQQGKERMPVEMIVTGHQDLAGDLNYLSVVSRDLSAQKHQEKEEALRRSHMDKLLNVLLLQEAASSIAHQLNQPLTVARSMVHMLQDQMSSSLDGCQKIKNDISIVVDSLGEMSRIIHQINDLFHSRYEPVKANVNLHALLR